MICTCPWPRQLAKSRNRGVPSEMLFTTHDIWMSQSRYSFVLSCNGLHVEFSIRMNLVGREGLLWEAPTFHSQFKLPVNIVLFLSLMEKLRCFSISSVDRPLHPLKCLYNQTTKYGSLVCHFLHCIRCQRVSTLPRHFSHFCYIQLLSRPEQLR